METADTFLAPLKRNQAPKYPNSLPRSSTLTQTTRDNKAPALKDKGMQAFIGRLRTPWRFNTRPRINAFDTPNKMSTIFTRNNTDPA